MFDLKEELQNCMELLSEQDRWDCMGRVEQLMQNYLKPCLSTTNHQETEPDQA